MPDVLMRYYTDNLKLTSQGQAERLLAEMGLLNMDEFDKYAENKDAVAEEPDADVRPSTSARPISRISGNCPAWPHLSAQATASTCSPTRRAAAVSYAWK